MWIILFLHFLRMIFFLQHLRQRRNDLERVEGLDLVVLAVISVAWGTKDFEELLDSGRPVAQMTLQIRYHFKMMWGLTCRMTTLDSADQVLLWEHLCLLEGECRDFQAHQ